MQLTINGEKKAFEQPLAIPALLDALGVSQQRVAVEVNRSVVPRARHAATVLQDGDEVEVVTFVGGG